MALYFNLPVYKDSYDLMLLLCNTTKTLCREYKFTIGEKVNNEALELLISIYEATKNNGTVKNDCIEKARSHLEIIRLLARLLKDLNIWSVSTLVQINIKLEVISKQLSQWAVCNARVLINQS